MNDIISWIQNWVKSEVNGDWEHELGFTLGMYDNPGWFIKVDISSYAEHLQAGNKWQDSNNEYWIGFSIEMWDSTAYLTIGSGINQLRQILYGFKTIVEVLEELASRGEDVLTQEDIFEILISPAVTP